MPALAPAKPAAAVRLETDDDGVVLLFGIPGRDPKAPIAILASFHVEKDGRKTEHEERELYEVEVSGQTYLRQWHREVHFKGSKNFPKGLEIGVVDYMTQPENGQPYISESHLQMGLDAYEQIGRYAQGLPFMSLAERRKHAADTEQWIQERAVTGETREGSTSPTASLGAIGDDRLQKRIDAAAEAAAQRIVDKLLETHDLVPKKGPDAS